MKTVLITGASSGIGKACVKKFYDTGYNVVLFSNERKQQNEVIKEFFLDQKRILSIIGDITSEFTVKHTVNSAIRKFKTIDVLVNNAGFGIFKDAEQLSRKEFDAQFQVNVTGLFLVTKYVLSIMKKQNSGQIINMGSMSAIYPFSTGTAYCATKAAVSAYTKALKEELKNSKIKVCIISPGSVNTPFQQKAKRIPNKERIMQPEDVAIQVLHVAEQSQRSDIDEIVIRPAYWPEEKQ